MELLIIWIVCGFIAGYIYERKGRSNWVGFIAGFLLGPIGIVLAAVTSSNLPKCPHCAEDVKPEAVVCKHCGRDLPTALGVPVQSGAEKWKGPLIFGGVLIGFVALVAIFTTMLMS